MYKSTYMSHAQVFVTEEKIITLDFIDRQFEKLNVRVCDGDKPSPLVGITLSVTDSNLRQHGTSLQLHHACTHVHACTPT